MNLTKAQKSFVDNDSKFIRLLAPAGCGKTFSIIEKTNFILKKNNKSKINIFTFTKNAANEIKDRCDSSAPISVSTLNSWGSNYIKSNVLKNAKVIDQKDRKFFVLNVLQPVWSKYEHSSKFEKLLTSRSKISKSEKILEFIDIFKNIGFNHSKFSKNFDENKKVYYNHLKFIKKVSLYRYYFLIVNELLKLISAENKKLEKEEEKHLYLIRNWIPFWKDCCDHIFKTGSYTFDDQKYFACLELENKLKKNQKWKGSAKMDYIFIDEFQDTSPLDLFLISNLQKINDANLIIVGDDDQAIYEFRGATPFFILNPDKIFENKFKTFILDENFRSPKNIVEKSIKLINNNVNRVDKKVVSKSDCEIANIQLLESETSEHMIDDIILDIKKTLATSNKNIAVLSRLKAALLPYQILLTKENISYSVSDDLSFFYTSAANSLNKVIEIKQKDNYSVEDWVELVCLFSKNQFYSTAKDVLYRAFLGNAVSFENIKKILLFLKDKQQRFQNIFTYDFIIDFLGSIDKFRNAKSVYDTLEVLLLEFGGLQKNYSRSMEDLYYRDPPLSSLLNFAKKYESDFDSFVSDFKKAVAKATIQMDMDDLIVEKDESRVLLSTALRVKGQEFDKVIIIDVDNGIWPKQLSLESEGLESERRLFYVATTRAKKDLFLYRGLSNYQDETMISQFVHEGDYNK